MMDYNTKHLELDQALKIKALIVHKLILDISVRQQEQYLPECPL